MAAAAAKTTEVVALATAMTAKTAAMAVAAMARATMAMAKALVAAMARTATSSRRQNAGGWKVSSLASEERPQGAD
jgi:hypothetical protein